MRWFQDATTRRRTFSASRRSNAEISHFFVSLRANEFWPNSLLLRRSRTTEGTLRSSRHEFASKFASLNWWYLWVRGLNRYRFYVPSTTFTQSYKILFRLFNILRKKSMKLIMTWKWCWVYLCELTFICMLCYLYPPKFFL